MNIKHMLAIVLLFVLSKAAFAAEKFVLVQSHDKALCQAVGKVINPPKLPFFSGRYRKDPLFRDVEFYDVKFFLNSSSLRDYSREVVSADFDRDGVIESLIIDRTFTTGDDRETRLRIWNMPSLKQSEPWPYEKGKEMQGLEITHDIFWLTNLSKKYRAGIFGGKSDVPFLDSSGKEYTEMGDFELLKFRNEHFVIMATHAVESDSRREIPNVRKWVVVSRFIKSGFTTERSEYMKSRPMNVLEPICYFVLNRR